MKFQIIGDLVDFVRKVGGCIARRRGHTVVAPVSENTDYAVCARLCAVRLGTYSADSKSFRKKGREYGIQYVDICHRGGAGFKVAVSASLASELPTLPLVLRALAVVPRSCVSHYS